MIYFVKNGQREGTAYHEFYRGKWDDKTIWGEDSIFLHDEVLVSHKGFYQALWKCVPGYDPYEISVVVTADNWNSVKENIPPEDIESMKLYEEANQWTKEFLEKEGCFTILGI